MYSVKHLFEEANIAQKFFLYTQSRGHACLSFAVHSKISSGCGAVNSLSLKSSQGEFKFKFIGFFHFKCENPNGDCYLKFYENEEFFPTLFSKLKFYQSFLTSTCQIWRVISKMKPNFRKSFMGRLIEILSKVHNEQKQTSSNFYSSSSSGFDALTGESTRYVRSLLYTN